MGTLFAALRDAFGDAEIAAYRLYVQRAGSVRAANWPGTYYVERAFSAVEWPITLAHALAIAPLLQKIAQREYVSVDFGHAARETTP